MDKQVTCSPLCGFKKATDLASLNVICGCDGEWHEIGTECSHPDTTIDMVNHPPHYTQAGIECIDAIKAAVTGKPPYEAWLVGQVVKYLWRYPDKNGREDLEKAEFYLKRLIDELDP